MFIKKIKGTYGIFRDEEISFKNGLNIIKRDNEWGKTTLISLIKVMFYGVNTSKRDKKDFLSEKTKYTSDVNFSGEMFVDYEGREVLVNRSQGARSMTFDAYFTENNQKTPFTSKDFGKNMLGVSEDAYANSALIEADNRLITKNSDLLDLILAMSTTGDTSKSFDKAMKTLKSKKQILAKSSGTLNENTELLQTVEGQLFLTTQTEQELKSLLETKTNVQDLLAKKRESYEAKYREVSLSKLEMVERANIIKIQSEQILEGLKPDFFEKDVILATKNAVELFEQTEQLEYDLRIEVNRLEQKSAQDIEQINIDRQAEIKENSKVELKKIPFAIAIIFGLSTFFTIFTNLDLGVYSQYSTYILGAITLLALIISFSSNKDHGDVHLKYDEKILKLERELEDLKKKHADIASKIEKAFQNMTEHAKNIGLFHAKSKEDVRKRINFTLDINERYLKALDFEKNTHEDTNIYNMDKVQAFEKELEILRRDLNECERTFNEISSEIMKNQLKLDGIAPKNQLLHKKEQISKQIDAINYQISSLDIAIETLDLANENLTSRLSPEISKIASHYFAILTENRYSSVVLQSDFEAFCKNPDNYSLLSKLKLSTGTREQLYFSLRLAICDVLLDTHCPIILDDPFAFYDDQRMAKALDLLRQIAQNRQIILFTCHSREEKYLENI
ncbi:MAG: AAA family ATPase [Clostridia bacterium]